MAPRHSLSAVVASPTVLSNGFVPFWESAGSVPSHGGYEVQHTPRGYTIIRGGPPFYHHEWGLHQELSCKEYEYGINPSPKDAKAEPRSSWNLMLPHTRDSLLGACVRAHVSSIPLYTECTINRENCSVDVCFHFALTMAQMGTLPVTDPYDQSGTARYHEPRIDKSTECNGQFEDWNTQILDGILFPASYREVSKSFHYFHDRNYPGGYTRVECTLKRLPEMEGDDEPWDNDNSTNSRIKRGKSNSAAGFTYLPKERNEKDPNANKDDDSSGDF
jgi:hypothetical protein